jgi:hypothetical protein
LAADDLKKIYWNDLYGKEPQDAPAQPSTSSKAKQASPVEKEEGSASV